MDTIIEFVVGTTDNPVVMAVGFLVFVMIIDSIFSFANSLVYGARR